MSSNLSSSKRLAILLVDDHQLIIEGTTSILQKQYPQAEILVSRTVADALSQIENNQPDVVIIDLSLPPQEGSSARVEHGISLLAQLMSNYPDLSIMVQSSHTKALIRLKHKIDEHQGGFTIADKSISGIEMLNMLDWAMKGITHTKILNTSLEMKPEWLEVLDLAFQEGLQDKAIAKKMYKSERMIRHYWTKIQDALQIYPSPGENIRSLTLIRAREEGLID